MFCVSSVMSIYKIFLEFLQTRYQKRNNFMHIADNSDVSKPEYTCPGIGVDSDYFAGFLHAGSIFIGTGYAAIDDQSRGYRFSGLSDLPFVGQYLPSSSTYSSIMRRQGYQVLLRKTVR